MSGLAADSGTLLLGNLTVRRLGYGTMQLTGPGVWGDPPDPDSAVRVLRRAVDLGVTLIDTADSYGTDTAELMVKRALHPYPDDLVIATKAGWLRPGPDQWVALGKPEYLRQQVEMSLRHLGVDRIDLFQLHRIDRSLPLEDQVGELLSLRQQGKIREIGLSEVTIEDLDAAMRIAPIVSVQNLYNLQTRSAEDLLNYCTDRGIGFLPWFPLATGHLAGRDSPLAGLARERRVTASQLALSWLLRRAPVMLPIPGTSSVAHLEENIASCGVHLDEGDVDLISRLAVALSSVVTLGRRFPRGPLPCRGVVPSRGYPLEGQAPALRVPVGAHGMARLAFLASTA